MDYDKDKVDDAVLALMFLTSFSDKGVPKSWKGHDFDALSRLHEKGYISDPIGKSVLLTEDGYKRSQDLFKRLFNPKK